LVAVFTAQASGEGEDVTTTTTTTTTVAPTTVAATCLSDMVKKILDPLECFLKNLAKGVTNKISEIPDKIGWFSLFPKDLKNCLQKIDNVIENATKSITNLKNQALSCDELRKKVDQIFCETKTALETLKTDVNGVLVCGSRAAKNFIDGVLNGVNQVATQVLKLVEAVVKGLPNTLNAVTDLIQNITKDLFGFLNGIINILF